MKVRALGHAGLEVERAGSRVLIDPWFSPEGAFQASWFPYPDNSHLLAEKLFEPDAIVVSHEHLDHLDPWFLEQVPERVPIVVPRYPSGAMMHKLRAAGAHEIVELEPWEFAKLDCGAEVLFVSEPSPMNHDSVIVVRWEGRNLVNLNDARLSSDQLRSIRDMLGGHVDALTFQGAGASWYPIVYRYPDERRRELSKGKRQARFAYAARTVEIMQPTAALPFAGPPCFLDPALAGFNDEMDEGIFPDQSHVRDFLEARGFSNVEVLLPGDAWDTEACEKLEDSRWNGFWQGDRTEYLRAYASRRAPHLRDVIERHAPPSTDQFDRFRSYFERLLTLSPYFNEKIGMRVGFRVTGPGGGDWAVDFRPESRGVSEDAGTCAYHLEFDSRWLPPILDGEVPWEDFFLSLRFSAWRDPDVYNDHLLGLLKFADAAALQAVESYETGRPAGEYITVEAEGRTYEVQRFCPHAGNDLLEMGEVLPGRVLLCLGHHYEFDLETGRCINGSVDPLSVRCVLEDRSASS